MKSQRLILVRGVSGSGKSTVAGMFNTSHCYAADDFFMQDGEYRFSLSRLNEAHQWCVNETFSALENGAELVVVHNTFTRESELSRYTDRAEAMGVQVFVIVVENRHGNTSVHNVPEATLLKQKQRLKSSIKVM